MGKDNYWAILLENRTDKLLNYVKLDEKPHLYKLLDYILDKVGAVLLDVYQYEDIVRKKYPYESRNVDFIISKVPPSKLSKEKVNELRISFGKEFVGWWLADKR